MRKKERGAPLGQEQRAKGDAQREANAALQAYARLSVKPGKTQNAIVQSFER